MTAPHEHGARATLSINIGTPPRIWEQPVVFLANLDRIFFGEPSKTRALVENLRGFQGYGSRLVPVLGFLFRAPNNALLLPQLPEPGLLAYFSEKLGLDLPLTHPLSGERVTGSGSYGLPPEIAQTIREHPAEIIDGYVTDVQLELLAHKLGKKTVNTFHACRDANDKILLNRFLRDARLPALDGGEADHPAQLRELFLRLSNLGYRNAVVRSPLGASGFGMDIVDLDAGSETSPERFFADGSVLVHGWIEQGSRGVTSLNSPSVQFACGTSGEVDLFDITEQLLSQSSVHEGNISPPLRISSAGPVSSELLRQAGLVASWVSSTGYRGTGSVDFLVCEQDRETTVYPCEVNARVTGATYPSLLASHLRPGGAWLMRNISFEPCTDVEGLLGILESNGVLFVPGRSEGILPLNAIPGPDGNVIKSQLLFLADTPLRCTEMIANFPGMMPAECRYERD